MIIEIEDRFCTAAKVFAETLQKVQRAAERGDAVHEVEEATFRALMETGRQLVVAYVQEQEEDPSRPEVIQYEGKTLHLRPGAVFAGLLRDAGNATPGGGAVGRKARHAGKRHVLSVAEVEWRAIREGVVPGS
jgi:hypothetical protein